MEGDEDPLTQAGSNAGADEATAASPQAVGQAVHPCNNWVDVIALDEVDGTPIADLPYKVFDIPTGDEVASGTTDGSDTPQTHCIDDEYTELIVFFGTDAAIEEARDNLEDMQRQRQLAALHQAEWNGIPAGLAREEFEQAYFEILRRTNRYIAPRIGILEASWHGWGSIFDLAWGGREYADREFFLLNVQLCWEEYQLVTGGREAGRGESFGSGAGNGLTFGFGEELASYLDSLMLPDKTYAQILAERQRIQDLERASHPNYFLGGEIAGIIPTLFIPVGGAAAAGARGAATTTSAVIRGASYAAGTGFVLGTVEGYGNARGGFVERMRAGLVSGTFAAVGSLVLAGLGVLVVRAVSRRVAVARLAVRPHWRAPAEKDIVAWLTQRVSEHPLRQAYEEAVRTRLGALVNEMSDDMSDEALEALARRANAMRREIGEEFKDATPSPLIDYIRETNMARYDGDPLGPTFDFLMNQNVAGRGQSVREAMQNVITSSARPNPDIDRFMSGFGTWLAKKPDDFVRMHWETLASQFGASPDALRYIIQRSNQ